jgi:hypothetical protein
MPNNLDMILLMEDFQRIKNVEVLKSTLFLVVSPCSCGRALRFGGTHRLHLQGRKLIQARNWDSSRQAELSYTALQPVVNAARTRNSTCGCIVTSVEVLIVVRSVFAIIKVLGCR